MEPMGQYHKKKRLGDVRDKISAECEHKDEQKRVLRV